MREAVQRARRRIVDDRNAIGVVGATARQAIQTAVRQVEQAAVGEDERRMHRAVDQATKMQGEEPREVEQRRRHEALAEAATELWREMTPRGGYDLHKQHSMEAYFEERGMAVHTDGKQCEGRAHADACVQRTQRRHDGPAQAWHGPSECGGREQPRTPEDTPRHSQERPGVAQVDAATNSG